MKALRLLAALLLFLAPRQKHTTISSSFFCIMALPIVYQLRTITDNQDLFVSRFSTNCGFRLRWRLQDLPGSWITLFHICPALRPRSDSPPRPCFLSKEYCPQYKNSEGSNVEFLSRLNHTAFAVAVYASHFGHPTYARLASGCWSDFTGWDSHPLGY